MRTASGARHVAASPATRSGAGGTRARHAHLDRTTTAPGSGTAAANQEQQ